MSKWEYDVCPLTEANLMIDILRVYGHDGWELVAMYEKHCYFKRPAKVEKSIDQALAEIKILAGSLTDAELVVIKNEMAEGKLEGYKE